MKSNLSTPGLLLLALVFTCTAVILYGLNKALKKTGWSSSKKQKVFWAATISTILWSVLLTVLSYKGFFDDFRKLPPRPALAILIPLAFVLLFAFSRTGTQILKIIPPHWLVLVQSFRIFVEVWIWFAVLSNKLPVQMSFEGRNLDIITGLMAIPVGWLLFKKVKYSRKIIIAFNVIGLLLLLNILVVAVLSMPVPFRYFMNEPSSKIVARFPFILLPGLLVPIAYSFHIFSLRVLFIKKGVKRLMH